MITWHDLPLALTLDDGTFLGARCRHLAWRLSEAGPRYEMWFTTPDDAEVKLAVCPGCWASAMLRPPPAPVPGPLGYRPLWEGAEYWTYRT